MEDSFELEPERVRQFQEQESKQDDLTQISGRFESDKSSQSLSFESAATDPLSSLELLPSVEH